MVDEPMDEVLVCRRWSVKMPRHRAIRPGWSFWEQERLAYLWAMIRPTDVVWEIGAEQGDVSVLYALWGAQVVLVEPDGGFWPNLRRIFQANGVAQQVVGTLNTYIDKANIGSVKRGEDRRNVLLEPIWPAASAGPLSCDRPTVQLADDDDVARTTLDRMLDLFPKPDIVTVDIDGAEYQMLLGADRLLAEVRPLLVISVHPDHLWDQHRDTPDDVWMHLELHGYEVERVGRDHEIHVIARPKL